MAELRAENQRASTSNEIHGTMSGQMVQAGTVGEIHFHAPPEVARSAAPFQLPVPPARFVAREGELRTLDRLTGDRTGDLKLLVLSGIAGVGKTSLALRWLHGLKARFDDGQLFFNLSDAATTAPVTPFEVLEWFLLSLGVPAERIPSTLDQRSALYRSVTANRELAVLLDNAVSAAQVRPLLPAGRGSLVVVTSRSRLSGLALDGAKWLDVAPMNRLDSVDLLGSVAGAERVSAEAEAAAEIADLCGGLPLALAVVAARLATRARRTLTREVADLRGESTRLAGLALDSETSVEMVLDLSCDSLGDDAEVAYRCCGWHPGREFGPAVVAAALGWPFDRVEHALDELIDANVVTETAEGRFSLHDLVRLHARRRDGHTHEDQVGDGARRQMVEWYLDRAVAADHVIHPLRPRLGPRYANTGSPTFADEGVALGWMETERANLHAALTTAASCSWDDLVWQLCEAQWGFFLHTRRYGEWIDMQRVGITSARRCGHRLAEARLRSQLGFALAKTRRWPEARAENLIALDLARAEGHAQTEATALSQLGRSARESGDLDAALDYYGQARDLQQRIGRTRGVALCRRRIGDILARLGRLDEAEAELTAAARAMAELGDRTQHTRAVMVLSTVLLRSGRPEQARAVLVDALETVRRFDSPYYQAEVLSCLAEVDEHLGDQESATRRWSEAADLYDRVEDPKAEAVRTRITRVGQRDEGDPRTP